MSENNLSAEQMRILLYQYFISNGDKYHSIAVDKSRSALRKRYLSSCELQEAYCAILYDEIFDKIQREILSLLGMYNA